jgi:hypothetical protein
MANLNTATPPASSAARRRRWSRDGTVGMIASVQHDALPPRIWGDDTWHSSSYSRCALSKA